MVVPARVYIMYPEGSEEKICQAVDVYPSKSKAEAEVIIKTESVQH